MNRNLWLVLGVSALFGVSTGMYEFVLPFFLKARGITFQEMGAIFALACFAMVFARIYMGGLADRWGRKRLYGWALVVCGGATALVPALPQLVWQFVLKTLRDTAALTRETLHPIVLYEEGSGGFLNRIGKFRGVEYLLQAGGTLLAGVIIAAMGKAVSAYTLLLALGGAILIVGALVWAAAFAERVRPAPQRVSGLRDMFSLDLHANLRLLAISGIIFAFGMQLSHSFYLPLFFPQRFGTAPATVAIIMVLHRVTIALPMLVVGQLQLKNLRAWYIWGLVIEGITMAGAAIAPVFWLSAGVFLLHDFIGAGIWAPIQATLIQRYSRDETRGIEVGKVLAWSSIGGVLGPLVAGDLAGRSPILPFLASGIVMALAAAPLARLDLRAPEPATTAAVLEPVA